MGEHAVLEVEEICRLRVGQVLWLVDLLPDVVHIVVQHLLDHVEVVSPVVEVSQYKQ